MLTIIEATEFLNLCPICPDIQNKILMLFIGINGTPTSNMIKSQIKCSDTSFNGCLVEKIILKNDVNTLWRLKVFLNKGITFKNYFIIFISSTSHLESANLSMMKRIYFVSTIIFLLKRGS